MAPRWLSDCLKQSEILDRDAYFLCQKARQQQPVEKGETSDSEGKKGDPDQKMSNLRDKFICAHPSQGRSIESEKGSLCISLIYNAIRTQCTKFVNHINDVLLNEDVFELEEPI